MDLKLPCKRNTRPHFKRPLPPSSPPTLVPQNLIPYKKQRIAQDVSSAWLPQPAPVKVIVSFDLQTLHAFIKSLCREIRFKMCAFDPALFSSLDRQCWQGWLKYRLRARPIVVSQLLTTIRNSPQLRVLDLCKISRGVSGTRLKIFSCDSAIANMHLSSLDLSNLRNISPASLARLLARIPWQRGAALNLTGVPAASDSHIARMLAQLVSDGIFATLKLGWIDSVHLPEPPQGRQHEAPSCLKDFSVSKSELVHPLVLQVDKLERLSFAGCTMLEDEEALCGAHEFPVLQILDLNNCVNLSTLALRRMSAPELRWLDLGNLEMNELPMTDDWVWRTLLSSSPPKYPELTGLSLAKIPLHLETFLSLLDRYKKLQTLQIEGCVSEDLAGDLGVHMLSLSLNPTAPLTILCRNTSIFADASNRTLIYHGFPLLKFITTGKFHTPTVTTHANSIHPFMSL